MAAAAVRGAATGGGFPPWRGVASGQRPPDPLRVVAFFFKGRFSRFFKLREDCPLLLPSPLPFTPSGSDFVLKSPPQSCGGLLGSPSSVLAFGFFFWFCFYLVFLGLPPSCLCCVLEMANSANTNTVVRTWFGGRRGLRPGGSNGRTGRGWGRWRLPASTLPQPPARPPPPLPASCLRRSGPGRRARGGAEGWRRRGGRGAAAGPGAAAGRSGPRRPLGRGECAALAPDPGRLLGRAGGEPPLPPEVGPAALAGEGLPQQP